MPSSAGLEFDTIFKASSANSGFTNITLEMQSPLGIATTVFDTASHYLYLGDDNKFDMAVFDVATSGSLGALTWEFSDGSNGWTAFTPSSGRLSRDVNDPDAGAGYTFNRDGVEMFPSNQLSSWGTQAVNSQTKYWIRVTPSTVTTVPQLYRIKKRPYATYCSTQDVFNFLQLGNITGTTDFTAATVPSKNTVEQYIQSAESKVDYLTRKSWRPNYVAEEYHDFNLNGFKLDRPDPTRILRLSIWDGADWETKTAGRKNEYFLLPEIGMVQFSRYFLLPARFMSYNAPVWRFGGGEFMMPIKVDYLSGRDIHADAREAGIVFDSTRKLVAIEVLRSADFGTLVVSGSDRMQIAQKIDTWSMEVELMLDSMRAFEVF
jgi:hypothetical protein